MMIMMMDHRFKVGKERHEGEEKFKRMKTWIGQWMRGDGVAVARQ